MPFEFWSFGGTHRHAINRTGPPSRNYFLSFVSTTFLVLLMSPVKNIEYTCQIYFQVTADDAHKLIWFCSFTNTANWMDLYIHQRPLKIAASKKNVTNKFLSSKSPAKLCLSRVISKGFCLFALNFARKLLLLSNQHIRNQWYFLSSWDKKEMIKYDTPKYLLISIPVLGLLLPGRHIICDSDTLNIKITMRYNKSMQLPSSKQLVEGPIHWKIWKRCTISIT